jgi:ABC-2 type transport system permease protein
VADAAASAWRQFRLERRLFWRNPSAAFFDFAFPLIFLGLFGAIAAGDQDMLDVIVPGIAGMAVCSSTFTALAYRMTFLRENGVLKRIRGTPLRSSAYLVAVFGNAVANAAFQLGIFVLAGKLLFGLDWPKDPVALGVFAVVGVVSFGSLGVALSHAIPNFDSATAYVNAIFLPLIAISGVFFDSDAAPRVLTDIAAALPLTHLIQGLSGAMVDGTGIGDHLSDLAVILLWAVVGLFLAIRGFRWESRRS